MGTDEHGFTGFLATDMIHPEGEPGQEAYSRDPDWWIDPHKKVRTSICLR